MSQWTHILGVIRYDSFNKNVFPEPADKDELMQAELEAVSHAYQWGLPLGSEGPLEVKFKMTDRGPTVLITGDMRDFGKDDIKSIMEWAINSHAGVKQTANSLILRDVVIRCEVEYDDNLYFIFDDMDDFFLETYPKPKRLKE